MNVTETLARVRNGVVTDEVSEHTEPFTSDLDAMIYVAQLVSGEQQRRLFKTLSISITF